MPAPDLSRIPAPLRVEFNTKPTAPGALGKVPTLKVCDPAAKDRFPCMTGMVVACWRLVAVTLPVRVSVPVPVETVGP